MKQISIEIRFTEYGDNRTASFDSAGGMATTFSGPLFPSEIELVNAIIRSAKSWLREGKQDDAE